MTNEIRPPAVDGKIYERFNREIGRRYGIKPGAVKTCLEEAMLKWITEKPKHQTK